MTANLFVAPVDPVTFDDIPYDRRYDALLCSVGYESRSRAAATALSGRVEIITGTEFRRGHNNVYLTNRAAMDEMNAEVRRFSDDEFVAWVPSWFGRFTADEPVCLAVDVSSMSRPRIGGVIHAIADIPPEHHVVVDLLYVPAQYRDPPPEIPEATEALAPVTPEFAGEPLDPESPMMLLFGLGYEPERAASAVDELAPQHAVPFFPIGTDDKFRKAVQAANADVLALKAVGKQVEYQVNDPFRCFSELEALVGYFLRDAQRPLLLPLGPKIFAAVCMLVAVSATPRVPVWRVSAGVFDDPEDREPENEMVTLRVSNRPIPVIGPDLDVMMAGERAR